MNANVNLPVRRPEMKKLIFLPVLTWLATACSNAPIQPPGEGHLRAEKIGAGGTASIPAPVQQVLSLPAPKPTPKTETYSVVVNNVKVQELLFALARDAKLNVDIHPGIEGIVTLNAIDQTLQQLLTRISKQVDLRWELDGPNLAVMPDTPFLRTYKVDYVNMSRDVSGTVAISTQIASTSAGATTGASPSNTGGGNNSSTSVTSKATNNFWGSVERNIKDILRETDKILPSGSSETVVERQDEQATTGTGAPPATGRGASPTNLAASPNPATLQQNNTTVTRRVTFREAASVIANPEAGVIVVRATSRQHEKVQEYLSQVLASSRRLVMIEATIAEISLTSNYQQGIDWSRVAAGFAAANTGLSLVQAATTVTGAGILTIGAKQKTTGGSTFSATLKLLETFGNLKVLSSPKLSVLNNQTAMLKVVDNVIYFTVKADTTTSATGTGQTTVTTTPNSVAVGLVMSVTPQISEDSTVLLNVRPTISRLKGLGRLDPNPNITIENRVPEIETREMESMLRLTDGEIAVMGGLMSDTLTNDTDAVPGLSSLAGIGAFFTARKDVVKKTELVILLKPTVIRDPSMAGDYRDHVRFMPNKDFFANNPGPQQQRFDFGGRPQ